jgi:hypothetical protein
LIDLAILIIEIKKKKRIPLLCIFTLILTETIRRTKCLYEQQGERPILRKAWNDQRKFKKEQRQKGNKPSFFRNSLQGQPSFREPRMTEEGAQR